MNKILYINAIFCFILALPSEAAERTLPPLNRQQMKDEILRVRKTTIRKDNDTQSLHEYDDYLLNCVEYLQSQKDFNKREIHISGHPPRRGHMLYTFVQFAEYVPLAEFILARGANPNESGENNCCVPVLWYAVEDGCKGKFYAGVKALLDAGADPDMEHFPGVIDRTIFDRVVEHPYPPIAHLLLKTGKVNPNRRLRGRNTTPLEEIVTGLSDVPQDERLALAATFLEDSRTTLPKDLAEGAHRRGFHKIARMLKPSI